MQKIILNLAEWKSSDVIKLQPDKNIYNKLDWNRTRTFATCTVLPHLLACNIVVKRFRNLNFICILWRFLHIYSASFFLLYYSPCCNCNTRKNSWFSKQRYCKNESLCNACHGWGKFSPFLSFHIFALFPSVNVIIADNSDKLIVFFIYIMLLINYIYRISFLFPSLFYTIISSLVLIVSFHSSWRFIHFMPELSLTVYFSISRQINFCQSISKMCWIIWLLNCLQTDRFYCFQLPFHCLSSPSR